jgi:hypothetical protein
MAFLALDELRISRWQACNRLYLRLLDRHHASMCTYRAVRIAAAVETGGHDQPPVVKAEHQRQSCAPWKMREISTASGLT